MLEHYKELMAPRGAIRSRAMFGGHGIYCDDLLIAIVADDQLYLKVDDLTQASFAAAGSSPFVYQGKGKPVTMSYWVMPEEAIESERAMRPWVDMARAAAARK